MNNKMTDLRECLRCGNTKCYSAVDNYGHYVHCADKDCWLKSRHYPTAQMAAAAWNTRAYDTRIKELESEIKAIESVSDIRHEKLQVAREALESIEEYWNRNDNYEAMHNACVHNIDTAQEALAKISTDETK